MPEDRMETVLGPLDIVDDRPRCRGMRHYWPLEFDPGDTCNCGAYYLLRIADRWVIETARGDES